jgi:hypothetical protein
LATERTFPDYWTDLRRIESTAAQFRMHPEWFHPDSSLLITSDPFGEYEWASTFIATVVGNTSTVSIQKLRQDGGNPGSEQMARYTRVISYKDGRYFEVDRSSIP